MIHFITGKGGVGKTYTALKLQESLSIPLYTFEDLPSERIASHEDLIHHLELKHCMQEYLHLKLKFQKAVNIIVDNKFFSTLFEIAPGVESIVTSGKIFEASKVSDIIVDSPSTGHFIPWLSTCKSFQKVMPFGPVRDDADQMEEIFYNPEKSKITLIAIAEEIVLSETLEMIESLKSEGLPFCELIVNKFVNKQTLPESPDPETLEELFLKKAERQQSLLKDFPIPYKTQDWIIQ